MGRVGRIASTDRIKVITCQENFKYETLSWSAETWSKMSDKIGTFH